MEGPDIGYLVYFIRAGSWVKVGYTENVRERARQLQTGNPLQLDVMLTLPFESERSARKAERDYRNWLGANTAVSGEWVFVENDTTFNPIRLRHIRDIVAEHVPRKDLIDSVIESRGFRRVRNLSQRPMTVLGCTESRH